MLSKLICIYLVKNDFVGLELNDLDKRRANLFLIEQPAISRFIIKKYLVLYISETLKLYKKS